ncbi:hypothetical protein Acr_06g0007010 [Actinidia rufa]|uniref:Uncharacterized protein n=1 Tax=Actinidia rufa TaxID=165716 RepID=A0A7J0EQJ9_9ERIC|nr:hypothetical protein Acr_06g0007010 [Actinidia rufa]
MERGSDDDFPGFQTLFPKDEFVSKRPLSRLQRRAPCPLQLKPSGECKSAPNSNGCNLDSSSLSPSSSFGSYCSSKGPIPLLSPLVLPSLLESAHRKEENTAKSH